MGSACSARAVDPEKYKRPSSSMVSFTHFKRDVADEVLEKAPIGYYLFSQDAAGERFLSVSVGKYVCHHPIFKQGMLLLIGGECFVDFNQVLDFYKMHPLGAVKLTKQFTENVTPTKKISMVSVSNLDEHDGKKLSDGIMVNPKKPKKKKKPPQKNRKVSFRVQPTTDEESDHDKEANDNKVNVLVNGNAIEERKGEEEREITRVVENAKMFPEVSSADEKEHVFGDEPIPVLPAPTGIRPPPLFQRFSLLSEEFADPFNTMNIVLDPKQLLFQLYKGNPMLQYTPRINTLKLIVTGQPDMYDERSYFITHYLDKLKQWAHSGDYYLEYIDLMLDYDKSDLQQNNVTWIHEQLCKDTSNEIKRCVDGKIPFLLLTYTGHEYGSGRVPQLFWDNHFEILLDHIDKIDGQMVKLCYIKDENSIPCSYVLRETDYAKRKMLADIFKKFILADDFPESLWGYFIPGRDLHTRAALKSTNPFVLFIERSFYDIEEHAHHVSYDEGYESSQLERLRRKSKCFYEHCLLNNNLEEEDNQLVAYETTFACLLDQLKMEQHCENLSSLVMERVKSSILSLQTFLESKTVKDLDYDEVLYHVLASKNILNNTTVHEEMFHAMKKYIQDSTPSALVVHGPSCCGKSSLLSRAAPHAFEFFNGLCCIVCRHIGHTADSNSFSLLLRSACLQLSYAYGTDPNAIPNSVSSLIEHFLMLLELATDSLPLVVILDSLDLLQDATINEKLLFSILINELPPYVRMIVSLNTENLEKIQSDFVVKLAHPSFTEERAYEYLDHMLVEKDRTLNHSQKDLVTNAIPTNYEPVFVRTLMREIEEWRSTSQPTISFDSITTSIQQLLCPTKESRIDAGFIPPFVYAVTLQRLGIPRIALLRFLDHVLHQVYELVEIQNMLQRVLSRWSCICESKMISGLEFVHMKDESIYELLLTQSRGNSNYLTYREKMVEVFKAFYKDYIFTGESISLVKQKLQLVELSFFHRILLQHGGNCDDIKQFFVLNFDYLITKLTFFSFCHMNYDIEQTRKTYSTDYEIAAISEIIELSKEALYQDCTQFPLQIVCRLDGIEINKNPKTAETQFLRQLMEHCKEKCDVLKPSSACLIVPKCLCNKDKDQQTVWKEKDLKLTFTKNGETDFLGWSAENDLIIFYNKNCEILKTIKFKELNRIILTLKGKLVIETKSGSNVLFDVEQQQCISCFHDDYDVLGGNHIDKVVLLSNSNMKEVKVIDTVSQTEVWRYESEIPINNVCCADDGSTMLCFSDYLRIQTSNRDGKSAGILEEEEVEQINVLDLQHFCKVRTITLPADASFSKLSVFSEDGHYFVRMTEPDMKLLVWEVRSGKLLHELITKCCQIVKVSISSRGRNIVTVSTDASIRVFSLNNGVLLHTLTKSVKSIRMDDQHCLSLSADGKFAIYYVKSNFYPSFIAVWNVKSGERLASLTADFYGLNYQISPDCEYILSNFPSGLVKFQLNSAEYY